MSDSPRIWVGDLAAYNAGTLHGEWIDASQSPEEVHEQIQAMLAASPEPFAEEWAIFDYENFGDLKLSEHESIEDVSRAAQLIDEHGPIFAAVVSHFGGLRYLNEAEEAMREDYAGAYRSLSDWAYEMAEQSLDLEKSCGQYANYIDWERVGDDEEMSGAIFTVESDDGMVHVFWQR